MRVLVGTTPLDGHVRPLLPLARALRARGHEVAFATHRSWHAQLAGEGFAAFAAGVDQATARAVRLDAAREAIAALPPLERRRHVFPYLFAEGHAPAKVGELVELVREWQPAVVVHESGDFAAPVAAAAAALPSVHHGFGTMVSLRILERVGTAVAPLWRRAGLEPDPYGGAFRGLYVNVVPPALDGDEPAGESIRLRLPLEAAGAPPPWLSALPAPLVYVTLGTVFNEPRSFRPLLDALEGEDATALVTVGRDVDPGALGPIPANVRVERYVPQAHVLPLCTAVVGHGGSGTTLGALAAGVPLVVLPQGGDQFENAARCERLGAAVTLLPHELTASAVRAALRRVLREPSFRRSARALAAAYARLPSPDEAAAAVEAWVAAR